MLRQWESIGRGQGTAVVERYMVWSSGQVTGGNTGRLQASMLTGAGAGALAMRVGAVGLGAAGLEGAAGHAAAHSSALCQLHVQLYGRVGRWIRMTLQGLGSSSGAGAGALCHAGGALRLAQWGTGVGLPVNAVVRTVSPALASRVASLPFKP